MNITIFGSGYVGLVTGACLAEAGNHVVCVDTDAAKVEKLRQGVPPIHEPGIEVLLANNLAAGRLRFTTDAREGVLHGVVQFIAVGTPPDEDGTADLQYVLAVAKTIGEHMEDHKILIDKSTVPVGTADKVRATVAETLAKRGLDLPFDVVSNPEFLKEGAAVEDFNRPDRIIIGTENPAVMETMRELYAPFNRNHNKLIIMDIRSAELTKYAANAMLATKISFMNEIANLAEKVGADIEQVRVGIGSDPRIGFHFIYPGCGFGGSCFPKDVLALLRTAQGEGMEADLLQAVMTVNDRQRLVLFDKIHRRYQGNLQGKTLALWGLAFKPNTDDMREAPSRTLMEALWDAGAKVQAYDPKAHEEAQRIYGDRADLTLCDNPEAALENADALVIVTEWKPFRSPNFALIKSRLRDPLIFDGRNLYDPERMEKLGFEYHAIGRGG